MKNRLIIILVSCHFASFLIAQITDLSLSQAYELVEAQYPNLKNGALLDELHRIDLKKLDIAQLPDIQWKADGRIQSEVPKIGGEGIPFQTDLPLYSLKTYLEANYLIYDGGLNTAQQEQLATQLLADKQSLEVEKYSLRERVNQLFVAILLNRQQTKLLNITLEDLAARRAVIAAGVENGVVLESEVTKIKVRELEIEAEKSNLLLSEKGSIAMLAALTGEEMSQQVALKLPALPAKEFIPDLNRPEQSLFQLQKQALLSQEKLLDMDNKPKVAAFAQAGVGYPNPLNFLDNGFAPFALGGIRFQWKITDWDKAKLDKERLSLAAQKIGNQRATFEYQLNTQTGQYLIEVERLQAQIQKQEAIANLQADILKQLAAQLEHGVITATDYLIQANAALLARQKLEVFRLQLLKVQLDFLNSRGTLK